MIYWDPEPSSRARDAGQGGEPGQPGDGYGLETQVLVQMSLPYRVAFGEVIKVGPLRCRCLCCAHLYFAVLRYAVLWGDG